MLTPWGGSSAAATGRADASRQKLFDDDLSGHMRMDAAEIGIFTRCGECKRKLLVRIEQLGVEPLFRARDGVGHIVAIHPRHLRADGNRQRLRREREIVDGDLICGCVRGGMFGGGRRTRIRCPPLALTASRVLTDARRFASYVAASSRHSKQDSAVVASFVCGPCDMTSSPSICVKRAAWLADRALPTFQTAARRGKFPAGEFFSWRE